MQNTKDNRILEFSQFWSFGGKLRRRFPLQFKLRKRYCSLAIVTKGSTKKKKKQSKMKSGRRSDDEFSSQTERPRAIAVPPPKKLPASLHSYPPPSPPPPHMKKNILQTEKKGARNALRPLSPTLCTDSFSPSSAIPANKRNHNYGTKSLENPTTSWRQQTHVPKLFIARLTLHSSQRLRQRHGHASTVLGAL